MKIANHTTTKERLAGALRISPQSMTLNQMIDSVQELRDRHQRLLTILIDYPDIEKTAERFDNFYHELIVLLNLPGYPSRKEVMEATRKKIHDCNKSEAQNHR